MKNTKVQASLFCLIPTGGLAGLVLVGYLLSHIPGRTVEAEARIQNVREFAVTDLRENGYAVLGTSESGGGWDITFVDTQTRVVYRGHTTTPGDLNFVEIAK